MGKLSASQAIECARHARTVAVLGIKPEVKASQPAYFVPKALQAAGIKIVPVPVLTGFDEVLGEPVQRDLKKLVSADPVDILDVFRPGAALPSHLQDILDMEPRPRVVWLQVGIRNEEFEKAILEHGIDLVVDRCLKVDVEQSSKL